MQNFWIRGIEPNDLGGIATSHEFCPGGEVRKIGKGTRALDAEFGRNLFSILRTDTKNYQRSHIAEDSLFERNWQLPKKLMGERE